MRKQPNELEDGNSATESGCENEAEASGISDHGGGDWEVRAAGADLVKDEIETGADGKLSTRMNKLAFALENDGSGPSTSNDETGTEVVHIQRSSQSKPASDTKAKELDEARKLTQKQSEAKREKLIALAKLVNEKGISLPPEQGFVSGTTEGWKHGKMEGNIAKALGKNIDDSDIASDIEREEVVKGGISANSSHTNAHAQNHHSHASSQNDDPSVPLSERLSLLKAKHSQIKKELDFELIILALSDPNNHIITPEGPEDGVTETPTPLSALSHQLRLLFSLKDPMRRKEIASYVWANIAFCICFGAFSDHECVVEANPNLSAVATPWDHLHDVLCSILAFACRKKATRHTLSFVEKSESMAFAQLWQEKDSPSFEAEYDTAKEAARLRGETTVLGVKLIDVGLIALAQRGMGEERHYSTFEHGFVIGVGPEGCVLWQAWEWARHSGLGEKTGGYSLDEWIKGGGDKVTDFEEGDKFVAAFRRFLNATVNSSSSSLFWRY